MTTRSSREGWVLCVCARHTEEDETIRVDISGSGRLLCQSKFVTTIVRMVLIKCSITCVLRINPQQQQQQQHHQLPPQNPGGDQQMRINHHSKGMMMGVGKAMPNNGKPSDHYPPKVNHQYRKYNSPVATNTLRVDSNAKGFSTMVDTHIPTVSANGIPGAAETTVSNLRTTASSSSSAASVPVPNGTILSNSATEDKGGALDGMLGKEKTAMCLVNELSRYNKVRIPQSILL